MLPVRSWPGCPLYARSDRSVTGIEGETAVARRPNYNFEKRQKELKRAKKKELKLAEKRAKKEAAAGNGAVEGEAAEGDAAVVDGDEEAAPGAGPAEQAAAG